MHLWSSVVSCALFLVSAAAGSCDHIKLEGCGCTHPYGKLYEIHCEQAGLSALPAKSNNTLTDGSFALGNFSHNGIAAIPDFYFNVMRHFEWLDFSSNRVGRLTKQTFGGLETRLKSLNMSRNNLGSVPADAFREYIRLKQLDLSGNSLATACGVHTADVEVYSLADNDLTKITDQCFVDAAKVVELDLSGNRISQLDSGAFDGLRLLQTLRLDRNQLTDVGRGFDALRDLDDFRYLSLAGNRFEYLQGVCDYVLPHVTHMDFGYNRLVDIRKYCFQHYSKRDQSVPLELNFEHNELGSLRTFIFAGLEGCLTTLKLNHNRIAEINEQTFYEQRELVSINLDNNALTQLNFLREWSDNKLAELSVANNNIERLHPRDFAHMKSLVNLTLDGNRLLYVESGTFSPLSALRLLSIRYNLLTDLGDGAFAGLGALRSLKLSGNALVTLKNCTFGGLAALHQFHFEDNLLSCDCDLLWLLPFISVVKGRGMADAVDSPVLDYEKCYYPEHLAGQYMQNKVSELCAAEVSTACFGVQTLVNAIGDGSANVTSSWDSALAAGDVKVVQLQQVEVKSGDLVYNGSVTDASATTALEGFTDGNIFKVCTTVVLADGRRQKSCAVWPEMIKKPTTPAPLVQTTPPRRMDAGCRAAIALAIILIIVIVMLVLMAVYLWRTKKYKHVIPEKLSDKLSRKRRAKDDESGMEKAAPPETNGTGDAVDYKPAASETDPMMKGDEPRFVEHDL